MTDIDEQFEDEWRVFVAQAEAASDSAGDTPAAKLAAELSRAAVADAKRYLLRLAQGEAPGRVILDLCHRYALTRLTDSELAILERYVQVRAGH